MDHQTIYLPLRFTKSQHGPIPPLCLLLVLVCLQQLWTILCLFLVCIFILNSTSACNFYFFIGGYNGSFTDEILLYNQVTDNWTLAGRMSTLRWLHALTILPNIGNICSTENWNWNKLSICTPFFFWGDFLLDWLTRRKILSCLYIF